MVAEPVHRGILGIRASPQAVEDGRHRAERVGETLHGICGGADGQREGWTGGGHGAIRAATGPCALTRHGPARRDRLGRRGRASGSDRMALTDGYPRAAAQTLLGGAPASTQTLEEALRRAPAPRRCGRRRGHGARARSRPGLGDRGSRLDHRYRAGALFRPAPPHRRAEQHRFRQGPSHLSRGSLDRGGLRRRARRSLPRLPDRASALPGPLRPARGGRLRLHRAVSDRPRAPGGDAGFALAARFGAGDEPWARMADRRAATRAGDAGRDVEPGRRAGAPGAGGARLSR